MKGASQSGILSLPEVTEVAVGVARLSDSVCFVTVSKSMAWPQLRQSRVDRVTLETHSGCDKGWP